MIKTARLMIKFSEKEGMEKVLAKYLKKCGLTFADIEVKGGSYSTDTHYGNWVLTPVLDNEASAKLAASMKTKLDFHDCILEASDIAALSIGDKVKVFFRGMFCQSVAEEGKVLRKNDKEVTILKKRSRSKGWEFRVGDQACIVPA